MLWVFGGLLLLGFVSFMLPQAWAAWGLLAFRRDWRWPHILAAAGIAALTQVAGGVGLGWALWRAADSLRTVSLAALALVLAGVWIRARFSFTREEIYRQGRSTRWPVWLAIAMTGPSEVLAASLAWLAFKNGASEWPTWAGFWGVGALLGAWLNIALGKLRLESPGTVDVLIPSRPAEAWRGPGVWVPVTAVIALAVVVVQRF